MRLCDRAVTARRVALATTLATSCDGVLTPSGPECPTVERHVLASLPPELPEASGLVVDPRDPALVWLHNDGDDGRIFAVSTDGTLRATLVLPAGTVVDVEDIAVQPTGDGGAIAWLGDVGDNDGTREVVVLVAVPLPALDVLSSEPVDIAGESFSLRYPGGPRDAEALFFEPAGALVIVTKAQPTEVFRAALPLSSEAVTQLESLGTIETADEVTGADLHEGMLAVRTELSVLVGPWQGETFDGTTACAHVLPDAALGTGEAIAWAADDRGFLGTSEGAGAGLWTLGWRAL